MDQVVAFLQTPKGIGVLGLLAIGAYLLYKNWGSVQPYLPWSKTGTDTNTVPSRREVLDYLDACYSYFEDVGCQEGMDYISGAVTHAFHEKADPPPAQPQQVVTQFVEAVSQALKTKDAAATPDPDKAPLSTAPPSTSETHHD